MSRPKHTFDEVQCIGETGLAIRVDIGGEEFWIPKANLHDDSDVWSLGDSGQLAIQEWWLEHMEAEHGGPISDTREPSLMGPSLKLTRDQRKLVDQCVQNVRAQCGDPDMSEGRCIEFICADFLAGAPSPF